jgi:hypothetical protein
VFDSSETRFVLTSFGAGGAEPEAVAAALASVLVGAILGGGPEAVIIRVRFFEVVGAAGSEVERGALLGMGGGK